MKLYSADDKGGSGWRDCHVNDYGVGTHIFNVIRPVRWHKFRVAVRDRRGKPGRLLQEQWLDPSITQAGVLRDREVEMSFDPDVWGIEADPGDTIRVRFVVHELAFRLEVNDEAGDDDEDRAVLELFRLRKRLQRPQG